MPSTYIRKAYFSAAGGPEVVQIINAEVQSPKSKEVQVQTIASGMGGSDIMMRNGVYPMQEKNPLTPGYCLVGRVAEIGKHVKKVNVGDLVCCLTVYDAHAEVVNLPEKYIIPVPEGMEPKRAVCLVLDWTTAYGLVYRAAKVQKGQRVFIHGLSGAVGNAVRTLCQLEGAICYGTASASNHASLRELGCIPFVYTDKNWIAQMNALGGAHVIFDPLGHESFDESWSITAPEGGHLIGYGGTKDMLNDGKPRSQFFGMAKLMMRNMCATNSAHFFYITRDDPTFEPELLKLFELYQQGKIMPPIKKELTLDEYPEMHKNWGKAYGVGSVVLNWD